MLPGNDRAAWRGDVAAGRATRVRQKDSVSV